MEEEEVGVFAHKVPKKRERGVEREREKERERGVESPLY